MDITHFTPGRRRIGTVAATLAVLGLTGAAVGMTATDTMPAKAAASPPAVADGQTLPGSFAAMIEQVSPAVVNIQVTRRLTASPAADGPPAFEEFFRRFFDGNNRYSDEEMRQRFGDFFERHEMQPMPGPREMSGVGSGFIVDPDGYIVTNHHVISDASEILVTMKSGDEFKATVVGSDPKTDLAVIKVDADKDLPFVKFGSSDDVQVGDWVVAVGNPFGLTHSATTGIVSARGRNIGAGPYDDFLQIDAPINRGNSGGPTFSLKGEVIGVNTAIFSTSGGNVGIGFAIPASIAKDVVAELKEHGKVERGWLGVQIQGVTDEIAESLDLGKAKGAIVADVTPESPAAKAGIKQGDVILAVDGRPVEDMRDLSRMIAALDTGETAELGIWRNGKEMSLTAEIGLFPETQQVAAADTGDVAPDGSVLGMKLTSLDPSTRRTFGIEDTVQGVVVADVEPGSTASEQGLQAGDVIVAVGYDQVSSPADVVAKIGQAEQGRRKAVLLLVNREAQERFIAVPLRSA